MSIAYVVLQLLQNGGGWGVGGGTTPSKLHKDLGLDIK